MTDKEYRTTRNRIVKIFNKWSLILGFRHWEITAKFTREEQPDNVVATCSASWEYKDATLTFHCDSLFGFSDKRLTTTIIHELCHVLIKETREWAPEKLTGEALDKAMRHEERVVSEMADAFIWAYEEGAIDQKKGKYINDAGRKNKKMEG